MSEVPTEFIGSYQFSSRHLSFSLDESLWSQMVLSRIRNTKGTTKVIGCMQQMSKLQFIACVGADFSYQKENGSFCNYTSFKANRTSLIIFVNSEYVALIVRESATGMYTQTRIQYWDYFRWLFLKPETHGPIVPHRNQRQAALHHCKEMKPPRSVQKESVSYSSERRLHQLSYLPFSGFSLKMDCPVLVSIYLLFSFLSHCLTASHLFLVTTEKLKADQTN